jgi:hypothetical protein
MDSSISAQPFTGQTEPAAPATQSAQPALQVVTPGAAIVKSVYPAPLMPFVATADEREYAFFTEDLAKSGLTPASVPGWYAVRGKGVARFCRIGTSSAEDAGSFVADGYAIPYLDLDGQAIEDAGQPFIRFRLSRALSEEKRADGSWKSQGKYVAPTDTSWHVYVPRATAKLLLDGEKDTLPLVITEGEKKAEAVAQLLGLPAVGLAGIHMWFDPAADRKVATSQRGLHPELNDVLDAYADWCLGTPSVLVVFDSDGLPGEKVAGSTEVRIGRRAAYVANPDVYHAAQTLARRLYVERGMSMAVSSEFCFEGKDGARQGLDDWILAAGADGVRSELLAWAERPQHKVVNESNLAVHILGENFAADVEALKRAVATHPDLYTFGGSIAIMTPERRVPKMITHESVLAKKIAEVLQTFSKTEGGNLVKVAPPPRMCSAVLGEDDGGAVAGIREIKSIATQPVPMVVDGVLRLSTVGYDPITHMYGAYAAGEWPTLTMPSPEQAIAAMQDLAELLDDMYLQSPADLAAMLAAMFTAVCRPGLDLAPGFVISAPNSGAGKSYIAEILSRLASSEDPEILTLDTKGSNSDTEINKLLLSALQTKSKVIQFDEINGPGVDSPSLRKLITAPVYSGRRLGASEALTLPTRKLVLITANNVDPTDDSARRFIVVRINPPVDPEARRQRANGGALDLIAADRARYVRAVHTLLAFAYPNVPAAGLKGVGILNGFPTWSRLCANAAALAAWGMACQDLLPSNLVNRQGVETIPDLTPGADDLGLLSPMLRQKQVAAADPARQALQAFLEGLWQAQNGAMSQAHDAAKYVIDGQQAWTTAILVDVLRDQKRLSDRYERDYNSEVKPQEFVVYQELKASGLRDDQMSNVRSLGRALGKYRDKAAGGFQLLDMGQDRDGKARWMVRKING